MKRLFKDYGGLSYDRYTDEANELNRKVSDAIRPLMQDLFNKGFSIRDIAHVALHAVFETECEIIITCKDEGLNNVNS